MPAKTLQPVWAKVWRSSRMAIAAGIAPVAPARRRPITKIVSDGRRLGLSVASIPAVSAVLRGLGANWFPARRAWVLALPHTTPERELLISRLVIGLAADHSIDVADVEADVDRAVSAPSPDYFTAVLDVQVLPLEDDGRFAVSSRYDRILVQAMRDGGGRFHRYAAAWAIPGPLDALMERLQSEAGVSPDLVYVHDHPMRLEDLASKPKAELPISVAGAQAPQGLEEQPPADDALGTVGKGFLSAQCPNLERVPIDEDLLQRAVKHASLYDYQAAGVRFLLGRSAALLADDMGLGKSRMAVVAARLAAARGRILVICPASLKLNWEREIQAVFPSDVVGFVGDDRVKTLHNCRWVISNYERLSVLVRETDLGFAVTVLDEVHSCKEHNAGRTRNAFLLASRIPRRFLLTGTPILSREIEVHTLLRMSGHPVGQLELAEFRQQYAGGPAERAKLATVLSDWMLRRPKSVLKNLGLKTRQMRLVSPAEGMEPYRKILNDVSLAVMPKIVKLRQCLEAMKLEFLLQTIEALGSDDKIIVFCEYMETVDAIGDALREGSIDYVTLVGADKMSKRQAAVDRFQQDAGCRVFVGTTSAAGVGITLTAANYVLFASLPWTPAMMRQAEDRAYRNGQQRDVIVLVPIVSGSIDEQVHGLLESKTELERSVVEAAVRKAVTAPRPACAAHA